MARAARARPRPTAVPAHARGSAALQRSAACWQTRSVPRAATAAVAAASRAPTGTSWSAHLTAWPRALPAHMHRTAAALRAATACAEGVPVCPGEKTARGMPTAAPTTAMQRSKSVPSSPSSRVEAPVKIARQVAGGAAAARATARRTCVCLAPDRVAQKPNRVKQPPTAVPESVAATPMDASPAAAAAPRNRLPAPPRATAAPAHASALRATVHRSRRPARSSRAAVSWTRSAALYIA